MALIRPSSRDGPRSLGCDPDVGEISVFRIGRRNDTIVKGCRRWRGASFDADDSGSGPARRKRMQRGIEKLGAIKIR